MADNILGRNKVFPIYNEDGTAFHNLVLRKSTVDSVVMSLGDKITGDVYYKDTTLSVTMGEYIVYNEVKYTLVNPPTVVKEGMVSDNGDLNGMTKYSFVFYHPMYHLLNFPFTDVAVQTGQEKYLSQNKSFSWIGTLVDYVAKINKNLQGTQWICAISNNVPQEERTALSEVLAFDNATIADALKRGYETWEVPYIIDQIKEGETYYSQGKRFLIQFGLPSQEIIGSNNQPFVFKYGQGVGLKNHSRNPRNNKIITRIAGYGSEDNIPWGYPQIVWTGNQDWKYTVNNDPTASNSYPIYDGIVGGAKVKLIKHPFTRTHLMPSIYRDTVNKKVNPNASGYNPSIEIKDYYDADSTYANPMVQGSPSYEIHEFEKIKPELGVSQIVGAVPYSGTIASDGEILLSDFKLKVMERASSTSIDMERTALIGLYDNITLPSSYVDSGSQEAYSYQSSIGASTDDKRKVEFKSSNVNFSEVVVVPNETPSSSTEWIDDIDENGNYIQGYFEITLPILSFDLYASAALTQEMQINMRSGACIGCTFPVQVDWEDYRKNFYDAEGNFAPNGAQRNLTKYPKSDEQQITVIVQKDTNTFGTLMPNIYQQPAAGDEYVILGISLPLSYISDAEERLDADMKQYMRDNNVYYFDYPLKFDEYFLAKNINILSQLRTNTIVRFQYNSEQLALYVKQLTIKYDNTPLPQYDITLTDDVEIVLNPVGQVSDDVSKLRMLIGQGGVGSGSTTFDSNAPFVRKDIDDTTNNIIRILKGLQLGENFSTGLLGEGGIIRVDKDGKTYIETDKLYVRMKFYADTIEVRRFLHSGGNSIKSVAGINCTRVEYIDSNGDVTSDPTEAVKYRCYFKATDNDKKITNDFVVGDLAFCGETNVDNGSLSQHRYWRAVVGRNAEGVTNTNNEMWIDLSATDCEAGSDIPIAQDDIIQLGNKTDTTRQGAIIEYVSGEDAPSYMIYQGINSYSLNGRNKLALGYNSSTGRAYLNVYGDFFFGDPTKDEHNQYTGSYIKYDAGNQSLEIKGTISAKSPIAGTNTDLEQYIRDMASQGGWTQEQIEALIVDETSQQFSDIDTAIQTLQNQADGAIETWFNNGAPTLSNLPASNWNTDALKEKHLGDLYYDNESGYAYRFIKTGNTYSWNQLSDSAVIKALANAAKAQDTADSKRKVFVRQPQNSDEYDEGDFWVNATYPATGTKTYENDILRAVTPKSAGVAFDINHWTKASKYTDDSALEAFLGEGGAFETYKAQVKTQLDGKAETWYQSTNPASNWTDTETKNQHIGDIWHNTSNSTVGGVESGRDAIWNGTAWVESDVPSAVYDKIDGKADIFVSKPTTYNINDMWIIESGLSSTDMPSGCVAGDIVISTAKRTNAYTKGDWKKKDRYTDDSALTTFINGAYATFKNSIQAQVDGKAETWYQATDPSANWDATQKQEHVGDIWHNTSNSTIGGVESGQDAIWNGTSWEVSAVPAAVFNKIDGKASIFINTVANPPSNYRKNDLWILPAAATINGVSYIKGEILTATTTSATYNAAHWTKKVGYTNDAKFDSYINQILNGTGATGDSATVANAIRTIRGALNNTTTIDGGLVLTSMIGMKDSSNDIWAGISGQYQANETGTGYKGHGIAAWYGGGMVDKEVSTSATNAAKSLFRFDGSGYLAGGNITWDKNGIVTIANVYSNVDGTQVAWSGQSLQYITNLATLLPTKLQSGVTYLDPKVSFWSLSIQGKAVATQEWVGNNYLSIAFFKRLFQAYNGTTAVNPNNTTATIDNIKAMFGFWTDQYLSALGKSSSGGSSGGSTTLAGLTDTSISNLTSGQVLSWNGSKWVNATVSGGGADISDITAALSNYYTKTEADGKFVKVIPTSSSSLDNTTGSAVIGFNQSGNPIDGTTTNKFGAVIQWSNTNTVAPATDAQNNWYFQLIGTTTTDLYWRRRWNGYNWSTAKLLLDSGNYTDYTVTKTGSGASGTWGISINGTAATATNLASKPSFATSGTTQITVTAGGKTSDAFTVPYATNAKTLSDTYYWANVAISKTSSTTTAPTVSTLLATTRITVGNSSLNTSYPLYVKGNAYFTSRIYLASGVYLEYDSTNSGVHLVGAGFYSDTYVSALGASSSSGSSGGSTTLEGLTDVNISNKASGQVLAWNGSKWVNTTISSGSDISDITAALSNYLPLSGGTMTGVLTMKANQYEDARNGALNMNNSDIYGANSIYFVDLSDNAAEGLQWYRSADNVDSLWVKNGVIYFTPNRPLGGSSTNYTVFHSGNYTNYIDSFAMKGWNVIDSTENDTVAKWGALKNIVSAYNATGKLLGQPQQYGLVLSLTTGGTEVHQMWFNQPAGTVYHRGGNASGWNASSTSTNAWRAFVDSSNLGQYLVGACGNGTSDLTDDTEIITSYAAAGGFDASGHVNSLYRRNGLKIWGYIKGKANNVYPSIYSYNGTTLANSTDLDTILSAGTYICSSGTEAQTFTNCPYTAGNFKLYYIGNTGTDGEASGNYGSQLIIAGNDARYFARSHGGGSFGTWKEFAYLTSNVASATKLHTARTLWGQSFDGTANVSGNMSSVGNVSMTGYITSTSNPVGTFIGSVTTAVINCKGSGGYMPILNAPTKNGRISLSTYPNGGDVVYLGYASSEQIQAGTNSFNSELRWSPNDYLALYSRGTTDDDVRCGVYFNNLDSTTTQISEARIYLYNSHQNNNGGVFLLQGTGNLVVGGGEGVVSLANLLKTSTDEATYIAADTAIYLYANCGANDNQATARKGFQIDTSANIYPIVAGTHTNNVGYLGNASYRFAGLYSELVNTNSLTIGSCVITWDSTAGMLKFSKGIYSQESVSALGANNSSATAATTLAQLTDTTISNPSNGQVLTYSGGKWVNSNVSSSIDQSTLNAALSNYVTTTKLNSGAYMRGLDIWSAALDDTTGQAVIGFNTNGNPIDSTGRYGAVLQWASTNSIAPSVTDNTKNWYFQLIGTTSTGLYWRRQQNGLGWTTAKLLLDSSNITDYAVTINTAQTISGAKTFTAASLNIASGTWIQASNGAGLLVYKPSGNSTISSSQWGVGAADSQGVIRSNNNPLVHYKGGTNYDIIDASGGTLVGNLTISGNGGAYSLSGDSYTIGLHLGSGGTKRGIYEWSPSNAWLLYFDANNTILNHGNLNLTSGSIITTHGSSNHVNGATNAVINCNYTGYGAIFNAPVKNGRVSLATYPSTDDVVYLNYFTTANVTNNTNTISHSIRWSASTGNLGIDVVPSTKLDVGGAVRGTNMVSTTTDGTAPFYASATTLCTNVNADLLDGWHKSEILGYSYIMTNSSLSSYWCKMWDATITNIGSGTERHMHLFVASEFQNLRGFLSLKIRQVGANDSGAYNFGVSLVVFGGNLPPSRFRLYYNNSTGYCALYGNVNSQWGAWNVKVFDKTGRYGEIKSIGTFYSTTFAAAQTLPSSDWIEGSASGFYVGTVQQYGHLFLDGANTSPSTSNTTQIIFRANVTQQVAISSNTNALIINPTSSSTTGQIYLGVNGNHTILATTSSARVGIGDGFSGANGASNAPQYKLHVKGTIYATGDVTALSDMRYKNVVKDIDVPIEDIAKLPVFDFTWKDKKDDLLHSGSSAQEIQKLFPHNVLGKEELSVNYGATGTIIGILVARGLIKLENKTKDEIAALKDEIVRLKHRIKILEEAA